MFFKKSIDLATFPLDVLDQAGAIFRANNWPIEADFLDDDSLFERFAAMLARLTLPERDLVVELSKGFLHCVLLEETLAVGRAIRAIDAAALEKSTAVFSVPLVKPADIGKMKSGSYANYLFRSTFEDVAKRLDKPYFHFDRADLIQTKHGTRKDATVILVDDFIGSGRTALTAVGAFRATLSVPSDQLLVIGFVAQQEALTLLNQAGVAVVAGTVRTRGISDSATITDKATALVLMRSLSARLGFGKDKQLGYGSAESLVSMHRCPNNTFPCYWTDAIVDKEPWPSPFSR